MSNKNEEIDINEPNHFWQTQYELLSAWQIAEADRFWTRFQISLALNGGVVGCIFSNHWYETGRFLD